MARKRIAKDIWKRFRIAPGTPSKLSERDPGDLMLFPERDDAEKQSVKDGEIIDTLQDRLNAEGKRALLVVLQGIDTAGKDGTIRHVFKETSPLGVVVKPFRKPSEVEAAHDFLWRIEKHVPDAGFIGVFDRSHYEDVLIGRVRSLAPPEEIERRYGAIVDFEKRLTDRGVRIVKVMLHISPDEQKSRLMERLERPDKHWKYNPGDVDERQLWPAYMDAYQAVFERTSTPNAPWYVVPANAKWYARIAVQALLLDALEDIDPQWPAADYDVEAEKRRLAAT